MQCQSEIQPKPKYMHEEEAKSPIARPPALPQIMQHQPTKQKENHHARPKYPLILLRPPLHHPNRIPANPQRIRHIVQPPLRALEHLALVAQIAQHGAPPVQKLVELRVGLRKEGVLAEGVRLARGVGVSVRTYGVGVCCVRVGVRVWGACGGEGRRGAWVRGERGLGVGVLGRASVVGTAAEELGACGDGLLVGAAC